MSRDFPTIMNLLVVYKTQTLILLLPLFFSSQRVNLSFDFPFYGHFLREITVATGGK